MHNTLLKDHKNDAIKLAARQQAIKRRRNQKSGQRGPNCRSKIE